MQFFRNNAQITVYEVLSDMPIVFFLQRTFCTELWAPLFIADRHIFLRFNKLT